MKHFLLRSRYKRYFDITIRNINQRKRTVPCEPVVRELNILYVMLYLKYNQMYMWYFRIFLWFMAWIYIDQIWDIFLTLRPKPKNENHKCFCDLAICHSLCWFWKIKKIEQSRKLYIHLTIYYLTSTSFYLYKYSLKRMFEN